MCDLVDIELMGKFLCLRLKFCVCEHDIPCTLEIKSNGGSKREHVESYPSTTTNMISTRTAFGTYYG